MTTTQPRPVLTAVAGSLRSGIRRAASTLAPRSDGRPRKLRSTITFAMLVWVICGAGLGIAYADEPDPTQPVGFGGLIPMPDQFSGGLSLFEWTTLHGGPLVFGLDSDLGWQNPIKALMNGIAWLLWNFAALAVYTVIALAWWMLSFTGFTVASDTLSGIIGASATEMMSWLAPSAITIGLLVSWTRHRTTEAVSAITWVIIAAIFGLSLSMFPRVWLSGTDTMRSLGADVVMSSTANAVSPDNKTPFPWPETTYGAPNIPEPECDVKTGKCTVPKDPRTPDQRQNTMLRKTSDAIWRGMVATPWCIIEFGSLEACQRYGADIIRKGTDTEARKDYINDEIKRAEGGEDAATVQWVKGHSWAERLGAAFACVVMVIIFSGLLLVLGFASLRAIVETILHLIVGPVFALLWSIEGKPRQWGLNWLQSLVGTILQGLIALLTFSATLVFLTVCWSMSPTWGWFGASAFAIIGALAAFRFRTVVGSWFDVVGGGHAGAMIAGAMAVRALTRVIGGARGGAGNRRGSAGGRDPRSPRPATTRGENHRGPHAGPSGRPRTAPRYRPRTTGTTRTGTTTPPAVTGTVLPPRGDSAPATLSQSDQRPGLTGSARPGTSPRALPPGRRALTAGPNRTAPPGRRSPAGNGGTPSRRASTTTRPTARPAPRRAPQPARATSAPSPRRTPAHAGPWAAWQAANPPPPRSRPAALDSPFPNVIRNKGDRRA